MPKSKPEKRFKSNTLLIDDAALEDRNDFKAIGHAKWIVRGQAVDFSSAAVENQSECHYRRRMQRRQGGDLFRFDGK